MPPRPTLDIHYGSDGRVNAAVGPGAGLVFVEECFPEAVDELLIATAFFSVKGYELARCHIPHSTKIQILVGKRDGVKVQEAVVSEIKRELRGVAGPNLYAAVEDIRNRMRTGRFRIAEARWMKRPFHCKFYISNPQLAWHGSANFSATGLKHQAEQAQLILDPEHITQWRAWFLEVSNTADDLHHELISTLDEWLDLAEPFDVYLKALVHLLEVPDLRRDLDAFAPVYFQKNLAAWALHQLDEHGGALLVVATGLGKTVIGAEIAGILHATEQIEHVVLLAPRAVHTLWDNQLVGRHVPYESFDNRILFKKSTGKIGHKVTELCSALSDADDRTLLLVDEAHVYRNQLLKRGTGKKSKVIERIVKATNQSARVVLLTGSVYGTSVQNLNSLLYLLPHSNPDTLDKHGPWATPSHDRFDRVPPTAVLGYPHVLEMARQRGDVDGDKPYVDFGNERKYLPSALDSRLIYYNMTLESEVVSAFRAHFFDQARKMPTVCYSDEDGLIKTMTDTVYNVTVQAWLSSPEALADCIEENLRTEGVQEPSQLFDRESESASASDIPRDLFGRIIPARVKARNKAPAGSGYKTTLQRDLASRKNQLEGLLGNLKRLPSQSDDKADLLISILKERHKAGTLKAIIFVERHVTARYLERLITSRLRSVRVVSTVTKHGKLKDNATRARLLAQFAPEAHGQAQSRPQVDVLVCTDADGVGVNLQDANIVINYDLTLGADQLVQRLGRVLRATTDADRSLHVYTFVPACVQDVEANDDVHRRIRDRYDRLFERHDKSGQILGSKILPGNDHAETIPFEGDVDIEKLFKALDPLTTAREVRSPAAHLSILEKYRERAEKLPHTVHGIREYAGSEHRLVLVFRYDQRVHAVIFDPLSGRIVSEEATVALNLLACPVETPRPELLRGSLPKIIDVAAEAAVQWCGNHEESLQNVERLAALYLIPRDRS